MLDEAQDATADAENESKRRQGEVNRDGWAPGVRHEASRQDALLRHKSRDQLDVACGEILHSHPRATSDIVTYATWIMQCDYHASLAQASSSAGVLS